MSEPKNDTLVRCRTCDREEWVRFGACLASGWPLCHGATMELSRRPSIAKITAAVAEVVGPVSAARKATS